MIETAATALLLAISALHVFILAVEMFLWDRPLGHRMFGLRPDFARATRALAANQGLYNGFLAAGLAWGAAAGPSGFPIRMFFAGCVLVAGLFGGATSSPKILVVQALPAGLAIALVLASRMAG